MLPPCGSYWSDQDRNIPGVMGAGSRSEGRESGRSPFMALMRLSSSLGGCLLIEVKLTH
jgi:hypothetical protein